MERPAIILLLAGCLWLLWKWLRLRSGVNALAATLRSTEPAESPLPSSERGGALARLSDAVFRTSADSIRRIDSLNRDVRISSYLLDEIGDAVFIVDEKQVIRFANRAAEGMFSATPPFVGSQLIEICLNHVIVETVSKTLEMDSRNHSLIGPSNSNQFFRIEAEPLPTSSGLGDGAWVLIRDVTVEIQTEQVRKDFVANASHELRTPLSIISGYLEVLGEESDSPSIQILQKHTERIIRIVDDMLTISKLESGDPDHTLLNKKEFDLGKLAASTVEFLRPIIEENAAKMTLRVRPDGCPIFGDPFYFEQIFVNLIENALKQNPKPGLKITVDIAKDERAGQTVIEVKDNGVGIPAADLSAIFKRFYRVEKHHSQTTIKGTGLGLSIVKRAIEAHHGSIQATSTPGKSTCFRIVLPDREP